MSVTNSVQKIFKVQKEANVTTNRFLEDYNIKLRDIIVKSEKEDSLYKYNENTYLCSYKTEHKDDSAIMFLFAIHAGKSTVNSTSITEQVMNLIYVLEKHFPRLYSRYEVTTDKNRNNIVLLQYVTENEQ